MTKTHPPNENDYLYFVACHTLSLVNFFSGFRMISDNLLILSLLPVSFLQLHSTNQLGSPKLV